LQVRPYRRRGYAFGKKFSQSGKRAQSTVLPSIKIAMQIGSARDCRRMQPFPTGWLVADWQKSISSDEMWQQTAAYLPMVHGGAAMATLLLLGALIPVHVQRSWRSGKNLIRDQ
jgi:hypothetical protein